jgi:hypothetical protein
MHLPHLTPIRSLLACAVLLHTLAAHAQSGSVTGQVFCSDTQKPARFATVSITSDFASSASRGDFSSSFQNRRYGGGATAITGPDGSFTLKNVSPGEYDLLVTFPGYVQPIRLLNLLASSDPATLQPWLNMLTRINVQAGQTTNAIATIYRGADVLGTVAYDDGSPAGGLTVQALYAIPVGGTADSSLTAANANLRYSGVNSVTDDHGKFHLSGLADGTYAVEATPRGGGNIFPVYLGNTIDRSQSQLIAVKAGSERSDLEIQIDINGLHQVRGISLGADSRPLADSGVSLSLTTGGGDSLHTTTAIDGSFTFADVPDGKYTVAGGGSTQVTVNGSDITDVVLTATH